jgi:hypothetical protein
VDEEVVVGREPAVAFKVELWFLAEWRDGRGIFSRRLRLSFVPFPGLRVCFREDAVLGDDGDEVREVTWLVGEGRFVCHVGDDCDTGCGAADMLAFHRGRGWTLEEG